MLHKSKSIQNLLEALSKFQAKVPVIEKNRQVTIRTRTGSNISYSYAELPAIWAAIKKPLADNGLCVTQMIDTENGASYLVTTLGHSSGEWLSSRMLLRCNSDRMADIGSVITYSRRYALSAALGLVTDEDVDAEVEIENEKGSPVINPHQVQELEALLLGHEDIKAKFLQAYKLNSLAEIRQVDYQKRFNAIKDKLATVEG